MPPPILIQTRTLSGVKRISELSRQPTHQELTEFLSFLGLLAMSGGLRYDPTVPDEDLAPFLKARDQIGLSDVQPIGTSVEDEFVPDMRSAFEMATDSLDSVLNGRLTRGHQPIPGPSVDNFTGCLREMKAARDPSERIEIAFERFNRGEKGAKLLVGLASQDDPRWLERIAQAAECNDQEALMSSLINLFRPFLLSAWAGRHGAVFAAPAEAILRLDEHQLTFWRNIENELVRRGNLRAPKYKQRLLEVPMLGVVILMTAPQRARPVDVVQHAITTSKEFGIGPLAETFWQLHLDASLGDRERVMKEAVADLWGRVTRRGGPKREELKSVASEVRAAVSPAASRLTATAVAATAFASGADLTHALATGAAGFLAPAILEVWRIAKRRDRPAAALSNLMWFHEDSHHLIQNRVVEIWRPSVA